MGNSQELEALRYVCHHMEMRGWVRDGDLATIGGGNHFVEIQRVDAIFDRATAYAWGVREGQLAFMVHSGSRTVGKYIGRLWREKAQQEGLVLKNQGVQYRF